MIEAMTAKDSSFQPTLVQSGGRSPTLRIHKRLAAEIGLSESIVLLQLEHLIRISTTEPRDGLAWTYQATRKLQREFFLFWHHSTVNDIINRLEHKRLIEVDNYNRLSFDRTRWIALNYDRLRKLESIQGIELEHRNGKLVPEIVAPNHEKDGPLRIYPDLAEAVGLNESIVLLQLDYLISISTTVPFEGRAWTRQSTRDLQRESFPWWSKSTLNRAIKQLKEKGLIFVEKHAKRAYDFSRWFALNYEKLRALDEIRVSAEYRSGTQNPTRLKQIASHSTHPETQSGQNSSYAVQFSTTIPETSTETPTKNHTKTEDPQTPHQAAWRPGGELEGYPGGDSFSSPTGGEDFLRNASYSEEDSLSHDRPTLSKNSEVASEQQPSSVVPDGEKSRSHPMSPQTLAQQGFLRVLGYHYFDAGVKSSVNSIAEAIHKGEAWADDVYVECKKVLLNYHDERLSVDDLPPLPESWWHFTMNHARKHPWNQQNFVNALLNRDALLKHCNYMIYRRKLADPTTERIQAQGPAEEEKYKERLEEWEDQREHTYELL